MLVQVVSFLAYCLPMAEINHSNSEEKKASSFLQRSLSQPQTALSAQSECVLNSVNDHTAGLALAEFFFFFFFTHNNSGGSGVLLRAAAAAVVRSSMRKCKKNKRIPRYHVRIFCVNKKHP